MRTVVMTLVAASAISLPAMAQGVPAPPAPAAVAAPAAPAAVAAPAAPAVAAPVAVAPAPAPAVLETLPTDGEIGQILNVIRTVCVPLVRGGDLAKLATPAAGFKRNRKEVGYTQTLVTKPYTLTVYEPGPT